MRAAFLRLGVKVLRFFRQKGLRFFEDKTSKTLKFRGEDESSIFEESYHPMQHLKLWRKFKPVTSFFLSYRQFLIVLFSNVSAYSFETSVCVQALQKFHGFGVKSHKYHNAKGLRKV